MEKSLLKLAHFHCELLIDISFAIQKHFELGPRVSNTAEACLYVVFEIYQRRLEFVHSGLEGDRTGCWFIGSRVVVRGAGLLLRWISGPISALSWAEV